MEGLYAELSARPHRVPRHRTLPQLAFLRVRDAERDGLCARVLGAIGQIRTVDIRRVRQMGMRTSVAEPHTHEHRCARLRSGPLEAFAGSARLNSRDSWANLPGYNRAVVRPRLFWDGGNGRTCFATTGFTYEDRNGGSPDRHVLSVTGQPYVEGLETDAPTAGDKKNRKASDRSGCPSAQSRCRRPVYRLPGAHLPSRAAYACHYP
jgi:hypothetical protein